MRYCTFVMEGDGPPILLLHGHPRTGATWHKVAPQLVKAGFTVVCPDLRGYGRSMGPVPMADHSAYSKRSLAKEMAQLMTALGYERFHVVGHDRGSYVGLRLALDHGSRVDHLALLDCIPISEHLARADARFATLWWHWFLYAQPDIPGRRLAVPLLVLWSLQDDLQQLYDDPLKIWESWADDVRGHGIDSGHHITEEAPDALSSALTAFLPAGPI